MQGNSSPTFLYTHPIPETNVKLEPLKWYDTTPVDPNQKEQFSTSGGVQFTQIKQLDNQSFLDYTGKHIVYPKESVEEHWKKYKLGNAESKSSAQVPTKYYERPIEQEQTQKFTIWEMVVNAFTRTCFKNSVQFGVGLGVVAAAYANFRVNSFVLYFLSLQTSFTTFCRIE